MNTYKELRIKLGMNQHALAEILGISRSVIAMAETGERDMPTAALIRLTEMEKEMLTISTDLPELRALTDTLQLEQTEELDRELRLKTAALTRATKKLSEMEVIYRAAEKALAMLSEEMRAFQEVPSYLESLQKRSEEELKRCRINHPVKQNDLKIRIQLLESAIMVLQEEINKIKN